MIRRCGIEDSDPRPANLARPINVSGARVDRVEIADERITHTQKPILGTGDHFSAIHPVEHRLAYILDLGLECSRQVSVQISSRELRE